MIKSPELALYDSNRPIVLQCDASSHSLGAAMLQDGRPVEFAAKSLSDTQQNYSQIEKEFMAVVFACNRFHYYIAGSREVLVETDHMPLIGLMKKEIALLTPRLAKMRLELLRYPQVKLMYRPGKELVLADTLSRACPPGYDVTETEDPMPQVCQVVFKTDDSYAKYRRQTTDDEELQVVLRYVLDGWPHSRKQCAARALPYWNVRQTLSADNGLLYYGTRLVIPTASRSDILNQLHSGHQGATKTLQRARSSVFWPGIRKRVEERCLSCHVCLSKEGEGRKEPLLPMLIPETPFEVVGIDPFELKGVSYLAIVDYYSKWPLVRKLNRVTSDSLISVLQEVFAEYGIPKVIVSDNGPQLSSRVFKVFVESQGIEHRTSSPLHASGNGQVERTIGTIKNAMSKALDSDGSWWKSVLAIRNTPVDVNLPSPAELLQGRILRDGLPRSEELYGVHEYDKTEVRNMFERRQSKVKHYHDNHAGKESKPLGIGEQVYFKTAKGTWVPGTIKGLVSDRSYTVEKQNQQYRRNRKDLRSSLVPPEQQPEQTPSSSIDSRVAEQTYPAVGDRDTTQQEISSLPPEANNYTTRSGRTVKKPTWLSDYVSQ